MPMAQFVFVSRFRSAEIHTPPRTHSLCSHTFAPRAGGWPCVVPSMAGKGREQGGMSGGARNGSGRKQTTTGLTRKQKKLAKEARRGKVAANVARMDQDELTAQLVQTAQQAKAPAVRRAFVGSAKTSIRIAATQAAALKASGARVEASKEHGTLLKFFKPSPAQP